MFWTIVALVMTVVMGGIIAYNGDLIGRKYGKRRVSMFGLRPKHTAILITSLTGVLISAVTTGVLFLVVPPVRNVILEGEEALSQNVRLTATNKSLWRENMEARGERDKAIQAREGAHQQLGAAQKRLDAKLAELSRAQSDLQSARKALRAAQSARDTAFAARNAAQAQTRRLTARNDELQAQNGELARQSEKLSQENRKLAQENGKLGQENRDLVAANKKISQNNDDIARSNDELSRTNVTLTRDNTKLLEINNSLRGDNDRLSDENRRLASSNAELEQTNKNIDTFIRKSVPGYKDVFEAYMALRNKRMTVRGGDDLARCVIPAGSSPESVRTSIQSLLHDASETALARGAGTGDQTRAVSVVDKQIISSTPTGVVPVNVTGDDRIDAVVNRLAWQRDPTCVLALAVANSVENEPALIDLQPLTDPVVFRRGAEIGSVRLSGKDSSDKLFGQLVDFLKQIGFKARQNGMIPRIDPGTGEPQVGSLGVADIAQLIDRVRAIGDRVRIRALAPKDVSAADSLEPEFEVLPNS